MTTTSERLAAGFGFPLGCVAVVAAALAADVAGATRHPAYSLAALGLAVLATALWATPVAVAGVTAVAWSIHSGFVLGRAGQLVFDGAAGRAALVFTGIAAVGLLAAAVARTARQRTVRVPAPRRPVADTQAASALALLRGRHAG